MIELLIFITFVGLTYFIGSYIESCHYESIKKREKDLINMAVVPSKNVLDNDKEIDKSQLVSGSMVVSPDYFKRILAGLRNIFGGEVGAYETLIDRARREAILRLKESCPDADIILNLRIETAAIGQSSDKKGNIGSVEVLAYGTAIIFKK